MSGALICLSVYGSTQEICDQIRNHDADLYEIRLDLSDQPNAAEIRATTSKPVLITAHGNPGLLNEYRSIADFIDVEQAQATTPDSIVSIHTGDQDPDQLWAKLQGDHITKIVVETENYQRIAGLLRLNRTHSPKAICFASGEIGSFSRILSALNGARWIYASLPGRATGNGQFTIQDLLEVYRIRRFKSGQELSVFGIVGDPVAHSLSPPLQNKKFSDVSLPWIYLPFRCTNLKQLFEQAPGWNTKGFSITHPYKEEALSFLDHASPETKEIRSCNTVAFMNGRLHGTNTDLVGIRALVSQVALSNARVIILGAGASARAIAFVVRPHVAELTFLNRTQQKAQQIASEFQGESGALEDLPNLQYDVLFQATSLGWKAGECPVNPDHLRPATTVIDAVYQETELLKRAKALGCRTINGETWFRAQAEAQFCWWKSQAQS